MFQQGSMNSCRLPKLSNKISRFEFTYQIKSSYPNLFKFQCKIFRVRIHSRKRSWFPNMAKLFYCKLFSLPCLLPFSCVIPNLSDHIASKNIGPLQGREKVPSLICSTANEGLPAGFFVMWNNDLTWKELDTWNQINPNRHAYQWLKFGHITTFHTKGNKSEPFTRWKYI